MTKEEALKKVKESIPYQWKVTKEALETLIPELQEESEDERIRKAIIELLKEIGRDDTGISKNAKCMIAWLEKQKEQKPAEWKPLKESMEALLLAIEGKWESILPTGYMSRRLEDLYDGLVETYNIDETYLDKLPKTNYTEKDIEEVKALKDKIDASREQKPADWSEDEMIRRKLIEYFNHYREDREWWEGITPRDIIAYLEKQKEEEGYEAIPVESTLEYKLGFKAGKESEKQKDRLADNSKTFESEDERIRKAIMGLTYIDGIGPILTKCSITAQDIRKYLEKQKINTDGDFARGYDCGYECCLNSHGAEWPEKQKDFQAKVEQRMEYLWDKLPDASKVENDNCTPEEWKALGAYMELEMNFDDGFEEKQKENQNNFDAPNESCSLTNIISSWYEEKKLEEIAKDYVDSVKQYNPEPTWDLIYTAMIVGYQQGEKQKEQIPYIDFVIKPHKGDDNNPYDMSTSEAQEYAIKRGFDIPFNDSEVYVDERHMIQTVGNIIRWADEHPKEQKTAEWSEEDEHQIEVAIAFLKDYVDKGYENAVACIDWLKSLHL